jgi:hypothetical protein
MEMLGALRSGASLSTVVPAALAILEQDPLATAGLFDGDLLRALMEVEGAFWSRHAVLYDRYRAAVRRAALARRSMAPEVRSQFWRSFDPQQDASELA